jgi:hypothetical protein
MGDRDQQAPGPQRGGQPGQHGGQVHVVQGADARDRVIGSGGQVRGASIAE